MNFKLNILLTDLRWWWLKSRMFFDSDDTMRPTLVESYRNAITQHGGALDLVATKACLHSLDGNLRNLPFFTTDLFANQILHSIFSTQRYAVRREYFAKFGGWNNDVLQWDDWELGIRLMLGQPRVATISDALVDIYESGEASITGTNFSDRIGRWEQALDEATHQVANSNHPEKERMLHLIDFRRIVLAAHYAKEGKTEAARELYAPVYRRLWQPPPPPHPPPALPHHQQRPPRSLPPRKMPNPKLNKILTYIYRRKAPVEFFGIQ